MQAVILAAGIAKRLRPITDTIPKCLINLGGKCFLARMIDKIKKVGITDFVIVTGYLEDKIKDFVKENYNDINVDYVTNPLYDKTQNCYSLWVAKDIIKGDFILLDGDILFDFNILKSLMDSEYENCLAVNTDIELGDEEMKIFVDDNNRVTKISKALDPKKSLGESIGIEKFTGQFAKDLIKQLDYNVSEKKETQEYYEKSFQDLIDKGKNLYSVDISKYKVAEIDTADDIEYAEKNVLPYID